MRRGLSSQGFRTSGGKSQAQETDPQVTHWQAWPDFLTGNLLSREREDKGHVQKKQYFVYIS